MSYNPNTYDALVQMGLDPKKHLPEEGLPARTILWGRNKTCVTVRIMPRSEARKKGITQRTRGQCPNCQKEFALGNLRQHIHGPIGGRRKYLGCQSPHDRRMIDG